MIQIFWIIFTIEFLSIHLSSNWDIHLAFHFQENATRLRPSDLRCRCSRKSSEDSVGPIQLDRLEKMDFFRAMFRLFCESIFFYAILLKILEN